MKHMIIRRYHEHQELVRKVPDVNIFYVKLLDRSPLYYRLTPIVSQSYAHSLAISSMTCCHRTMKADSAHSSLVLVEKEQTTCHRHHRSCRQSKAALFLCLMSRRAVFCLRADVTLTGRSIRPCLTAVR